MPAKLTKNGDQLELSLAGCRGMEFMDAKDKIKDIPGRRFDFDTKLWIVPADPQTAERVLKTVRPECDQELLNWISASKTQHEESLTSPLPDDASDLLIPWANRRAAWQPEVVNDNKVVGLLPYQRAAVKVMAERTRAILADDMGLGKTLQAISTIEEFSLRNGQVTGPKLIIAPASVMGGWARELHRWLEDPSVVMLPGSMAPKKRHDLLVEGIENSSWIIANWEQLRVKKEKRKVKMRNGGTRTVTEKMMKESLFEDTEWLGVIADEIHRAKNRDSQQTQGLWRVQGQVMLGATGTPVMNSPDELWAILRWLWPTEFHEQGMRKNATAYWAFYEEYVDYWEDHFGRKVITGVKNPDALRFVLRDKLIRRTASILGLKGRKRIYVPVSLNPGQQKLYDEAETAMWLEIAKEAEGGDGGAGEIIQRLKEGTLDAANLLRIPNGAARVVRLQQIIENPALLGGPDDSAIMDDFEARFEASGMAQWVVFCKFKESCDILAQRLRDKYGVTVGVYHGDVKPAERTKLEDNFQIGEVNVIVGTIGAMKEGITLTASHFMYFMTRDWVPDVNEQCEAREDRLGQQELVRVIIPQAEDTVAVEKVEPTNRLKEQIVKSIIPKQTIKEDNQ